MSTKFFTTFQINNIDFFVIAEEGKIIKIGLNENLPEERLMVYKSPDDKIFSNCYQQLKEYFLNGRKKFNLQIKLRGTNFQKKVWSTLKKIPYGKTVSYQDIAIKINNPKAFRAVGLANKKNPIPIIIPCHRVIGQNGSLRGYSSGLELKSKLLEIEAKNIHNKTL